MLLARQGSLAILACALGATCTIETCRADMPSATLHEYTDIAVVTFANSGARPANFSKKKVLLANTGRKATEPIAPAKEPIEVKSYAKNFFDALQKTAGGAGE